MFNVTSSVWSSDPGRRSRSTNTRRRSFGSWELTTRPMRWERELNNSPAESKCWFLPDLTSSHDSSGVSLCALRVSITAGGQPVTSDLVTVSGAELHTGSGPSPPDHQHSFGFSISYRLMFHLYCPDFNGWFVNFKCYLLVDNFLDIVNVSWSEASQNVFIQENVFSYNIFCCAVGMVAYRNTYSVEF